MSRHERVAYLLNLGDDLSSQARLDCMRLHQTQRGVCTQVALAHSWLLKEEAQFGSSSVRCI